MSAFEIVGCLVVAIGLPVLIIWFWQRGDYE
jgi:hypothetical protein